MHLHTGHVSRYFRRQSSRVSLSRRRSTHQSQPIHQTIHMKRVRAFWNRLHPLLSLVLAQTHATRRAARQSRLCRGPLWKRLHRRRRRRRVEVSRVQQCEIHVSERSYREQAQRRPEEDGENASMGRSRFFGKTLEENARARGARALARVVVERGRVDVDAGATIVAPHRLHGARRRVRRKRGAAQTRRRGEARRRGARPRETRRPRRRDERTRAGSGRCDDHINAISYFSLLSFTRAARDFVPDAPSGAKTIHPSHTFATSNAFTHR